MGIDAKALAAKLEEWDTMVEATRFAMEQLMKKGDKLADHIEELEANLSKAVEAFDCWRSMMDNPAYDMGEMVTEFDAIVCTALAELTGGKDE